MTKKSNPGSIGWCPVHEKYFYTSRKQARRVADIQHPGRHFGVYACDDVTSLWHYGTVPPAVLYGLKTRREVYGPKAA